MKYGEDLNLPEEEEDNEDEEAEKDANAIETDSEMEDYYKELGIENEVDYSKKDKEYIKKKKVVKKETKAVTSEDGKKKILDEIIQKTQSSGTYGSLTKIIKIVK